MPRDTQESAFWRFRTYRNYLVSIRQYLTETYGQRIHEGIRSQWEWSQTRQRAKAAPRTSPDATPKALTLLRSAWNTEYLLVFPGQFDVEYIRAANHWIPVQGYYAVYLAGQSLLEAEGYEGKKKHAAVLASLASLAQRGIFPSPWNVMATGWASKEGIEFLNLPPGHDFITCRPISEPQPEEFWSRYTTLLRTTREELMQASCRTWLRQHPTTKGTPRKRITREGKTEVGRNFRPTTIFECLFRLRCRSNYGDADLFLSPEVDDNHVLTYFDAFAKTVSATLHILEQYIAAKVGEGTFRACALAFIDKHPEEPPMADRLDHILCK